MNRAKFFVVVASGWKARCDLEWIVLGLMPMKIGKGLTAMGGK